MSMPKLLLWIATVGVAIYIYVFGFNRVIQNVTNQFGGLEQNIQGQVSYVIREIHLDQLASNVHSEVKSFTDGKSSQDQASLKKERHARRRRVRDETGSQGSPDQDTR
jgi:hypothetical protein